MPSEQTKDNASSLASVRRYWLLTLALLTAAFDSTAFGGAAERSSLLSALLVTCFAQQLGLLALWLVHGKSDWRWRTAVSVGLVAAIYPLEGVGLFLAWHGAAAWLVAVVLQHLPRGTTAADRRAEPSQFSVAQIMVAVTLAAVLLAVTPRAGKGFGESVLSWVCVDLPPAALPGVAWHVLRRPGARAYRTALLLLATLAVGTLSKYLSAATGPGYDVLLICQAAFVLVWLVPFTLPGRDGDPVVNARPGDAA